MDEIELIDGARQGDEQAWRALIRTHQDAVFRLAYLLLGDAEEAEDVAQETFLQTFRVLHRYDQARPFRPWLLQVAKNLARNRYRALRRYWRAVQRWTMEHQSAHSATPNPVEPGPIEHNEIAREEAELLWQAIRRLNHKEQEVIYLRCFLELSVAETAATLDIAEGTVKSRLHRAQNRLAKIVENEFPMLKNPMAQATLPNTK